MANQTLQSTITSKGQVTLPVAIRRRLNLRDHDRVEFVVDDQGRIELQVPKYPTVASLVGAAGSLGRNMTMQEMREIANRERFERTTPEVDDAGIR